MKTEKISNYVLYALAIFIVLSFLAFFLIGYDNMEGSLNAPKLTGYLLIVQYLLGVGGVAVMIWNVVSSVRKSSGGDEKATKGLPATKISMFAIIITVASLVIGLLTGLGEEDFTTTSGVFTEGYMVTVVDMFLCSIYILAIVAIVAVVVSMSGVLKK